jgi:N-acetylated-alpha-linked acidic dipeptidase
MLKLFQREFGVDPPLSDPIFEAGSEESRGATLGLSQKHNDLPTAWVDVYYPYLDEPVNSTLEILDQEGLSVWTADLVEDGNPLDPEAHHYRNDIPPWLGYSANGTATGKVS